MVCSGLTSVTIPNSVTKIENYAFYECRNLNNVYCHLRRSPVMGKDVFGEIDLVFSVLYVPNESVKGYSQTEPWSNFGSIWPMSQVPEGIKNPFNDDVQTIQYDMTGRRKSSNSAGLTITVDGNGNTRKTIVVKK